MIRKLLVLSLIIVVLLAVILVFVVPVAMPFCAWPEARTSIQEYQEAQSWKIEENRDLEEFAAHAIVEQKGLSLSLAVCRRENSKRGPSQQWTWN